MTDYPRSGTWFLEGPFGAGKTTYAIKTLFAWLESGVAPEQIMVLVPQRTLGRPYQLALGDASRGPLGHIEVRTLSGLAGDMVKLHWPLISEEAGFAKPEQEPRFLTIETAQYTMAEFVDRAVQRGEFDAINVSPQQIARQIIDNLGKAALLGIDYQRIPDMLSAAWGSDRPRKRILAYQAAGQVARAYRQHCLAHRLLDYSLQIELFNRLRQQPLFHDQFFGGRTHLIADNLEEDNSLTHDLIREWLPHLRAALLVYEWDGGYRVFLGADPAGAEALREDCDEQYVMAQSHVMQSALDGLVAEVGYSLRRTGAAPAAVDVRPAFRYEFHNYYPEMLDWVAANIYRLVHDEGIPLREIVILAPFLSDALRFSLSNKLEQYGIPVISHRPSRALRDEPAARCLLTLTALAHPEWDYLPPRADVADALYRAIADLDPVRARLLAQITYHPRGDLVLSSFEMIRPEMQGRITYVAGERFDNLREWLLGYAADGPAPVDHFFNRLFGEVLSQPGYGFHTDHEAGRVVAELVESAQRFRHTLFTEADNDVAEVGRRYLRIVNQGLLAALYVASWRDEQADAVFMVPAYTFLMRNRVAEVQFWLDVGSTGWWERLDQPLTHPYVLSRRWPPGALWTDSHEYEHQQGVLYRVMSGLIRRCRREIVLGISDLGEQGYEQRGPMLRVFQQILRRHPHEVPDV